MFSTASVMPVWRLSPRMPATKLRAYSRCQMNGGCTTTTSAPRSVAAWQDRRSFSQGSVPQTFWVITKQGECTLNTGTWW